MWPLMATQIPPSVATSNSPPELIGDRGVNAGAAGTCWQDSSSGLPRGKAKE